MLIELIKVIGSVSLGALSSYFAIKLELLKIKSRNPNKNELLQNSIKLAQDIDEQLFVILNEIGCDRISLSTFSNGAKFYTGEPMQFVNMSFEKVQRGILPISKDFTRVPISQFGYFYSQFKSSDVAHFKVSEVKDDTYREIMKYYDNVGIYGFIVYNSKNEWIGVLQLNWTKSEVTLDEEDIAYVRLKCNIIGDMLENWERHSSRRKS